jgi:hypothetical protein
VNETDAGGHFVEHTQTNSLLEDAIAVVDEHFERELAHCRIVLVNFIQVSCEIFCGSFRAETVAILQSVRVQLYNHY